MTVYVITGPPAAGKTTWIRERAKPGDITIDYDDLVQALSPGLSSDPAEQPKDVVDVAMAARRAAINEAAEVACDVYVVHAMPSKRSLQQYTAWGWQVITVDPGRGECMRRAVEGGRTARQLGVIEDWYQRHGHE